MCACMNVCEHVWVVFLLLLLFFFSCVCRAHACVCDMLGGYFLLGGEILASSAIWNKTLGFV